MPCCYVLHSSTVNKRYIGSSREDSPKIRLESHNLGRTRSTKAGRPWTLLFFEKYATYTEARKRELFLKTGQGRKFLNSLQQGEVA